LLVLADPAEQGGQVAGCELPVEPPGGLVVAVSEGQQSTGQLVQAGSRPAKSFGETIFFWMREKKIWCSQDACPGCGS
jgi:hypothetical protein